ncbi:AGAP000788-PA-like protein [Anopheles sinensis]|uniref:AGAP000788-PA-like protein n=1 Tax=Anopheles sinensis TaxID=74873 RepID=A0A084VIV0_ANOSI|nr:AGAP000788-PA-like protein [Anopheles sinensis]
MVSPSTGLLANGREYYDTSCPFSLAFKVQNNFRSRSWHKLTLADDQVEVVKSVSPGDDATKRDNDSDQVALESVDQDLQGSAPVQSYPQHLPPPHGGHGPPHGKHGPGPQHGPGPHHGPLMSHGPNRGSLGLGQPFGPPPPPPPPQQGPHAYPVAHAYHGPPPPPPPQPSTAHLKAAASELIPEKLYGAPPPPLPSGNELWSSPLQDMPKIVSLDVKCEKQGMKVFVQFDKPFFGIVFSKGHYSNVNCVHLPAGLGKTSASFDIGIHECGTAGNTDNVLYNGYSGTDTNAGSYFENIIVLQYDPQVQEVWDQARKLRCTWHDQYEKSVTFRPFPVDMLDVIRADFAGDNVGCWMQIQVGKGPWASEVSGLVKIGQTMTMVLAIKDDDGKFDMLVRNCMAHDGKRAPIQLVDQRGCVTRPKLMSRFTKIKNFGASASVLSYAHFQAFKFPDSMEVHFQCTIQICRYQCPEQCTDPGVLDVHHLSGGPEHQQYGPPPPPPPSAQSTAPTQSLDAHVFASNRKRDDRRIRRTRAAPASADQKEDVGLNRVIRVVSPGDLTFPIGPGGASQNDSEAATMVFSARDEGLICMTTPGFTVTIVVLLSILLASCITSAFLCIRLKPFSLGGPHAAKERSVAFTNPHLTPAATSGTLKSTKSSVTTASSTTTTTTAANATKARLFYT